MTDEEDEERQIACGCPCHQDRLIVHPVPCCVPCQLCGISVAPGIAHGCAPLGAQSRTVVPWGKLIARYYTNAPLVVALLVMGLAAWSVPYPGRLLFVAVGLLGAFAAVRRIRHPGPGMPHVVEPPDKSAK